MYVCMVCVCTCTVVSHKYAPPFCNLILSTKHRGGLYVGCDNFSRDYALPSGHEVIVGGGWGQARGVAKHKGERCSRH